MCLHSQLKADFWNFHRIFGQILSDFEFWSGNLMKIKDFCLSNMRRSFEAKCSYSIKCQFYRQLNGVILIVSILYQIQFNKIYICNKIIISCTCNNRRQLCQPIDHSSVALLHVANLLVVRYNRFSFVQLLHSFCFWYYFVISKWRKPYFSSDWRNSEIRLKCLFVSLCGSLTIVLSI